MSSSQPAAGLDGGVILDVRGLKVARSGTLILNDVSWRVLRGEHWVILGPNGSGKTSLLSALTGYLMPTAGIIEVLNHRYGKSDWRELRKRIGLVSSSIRQMMAETEPALEAVVGGKYAELDLWRRVSPAERREARRILRLIECPELEKRPWTFLSQGERQRILIGRALMARPALLILDEPCAGLDPVARERFLQWMERLGSAPGGPTLVLVTHHVEEIMPAFSHALLLNRGECSAIGLKDRVLTSTALAKAFETPVRIRKRQGRYALRIQSGDPATVV